ncbi:D-glycerate dehydrogenase [Halobacteriovorax sp. JY17]|uniref:2-hydroxyacid dehydrogenase n=1 Tax=Halobacteriovorax sp. JY17 TaxID=2014617 RepID=UPI000C4B2AB3|nr:D-glycerate dehydrogenase [Halobacteriovorax sp. JY17]PIK15744.1 MAG: D-glycerate dehydrogenase [Halobacteriovorax sp. JY17]
MRIFITKPILEDATLMLQSEGHHVIVHHGDSPLTTEELYLEAKASDALITMLSDKIDRDFLSANQHLKVISNYAVGYNNIDVSAATEFGIKIGNTPDVLTEATADLALSLLLDVSRKITESMRSIESGNWKGWEPLGFIGQSMRGKTLGIFGAGRIGQCFAETCNKAFGMEILYCSRSEKPDFQGQRVSLEELLSKSDVISIHCDLNSETEDLFNFEAFKKMKESAIFINTARGQVHNEEDLEKAIRERVIWGAGLDVTNPEPMSKDSPLLGLENVVITPHIGSATQIARSQMSKLVATNILNGLNGDKLTAGIN